MKYVYPTIRFAAILTILASLVVAVANGWPPERKALFRQDLHPFGFLTVAHGRSIASFTDINFLSDDLLLVTVNQRSYGPIEKLLSDQPPSTLLLFDVSQRVLLKTKEMSVEKASGSVMAVEGGQFILLNESGLRLCSQELECGLPFVTRGPLFVSPAGTRVAVGGNGQTEQELLDAASLKELDRFAWHNPTIIPGEHSLLIRQGGKLYVRLPEHPDQQLSFGGSGVWPEARFLNDTTIADYESDKALAVAKIDGTILFRVPTSARWHVTEVATAASGSRFCFHEARYTTLNSVVNFLDIDSGRPFNFEEVRVLSTNSGKSLFELHWDPRPYIGYLSAPALSPNGRRLAVIRNGFLEIFEVP
jgi:hypothetical protein